MHPILSRRAVLFWAARFTTSYSSKKPRLYGKKGPNSRSENSAFFVDVDDNDQHSHVASSHSSPSPAPARPFPPHISEEVQDAADVNAAASAANRRAQVHNYRSPSLLNRSNSSAGSNSPESTMSSHDQQEPASGSNDPGSEPFSSPRSTSEVSADIRKLGISGRSASPAKRTFADSQDDGHEEAQTTTYGTELDSERMSKHNGNGIRSPMPSRHKPMPSIEVNDQAYQDETLDDASNDMQREDDSAIVHGQAKDLPSLGEQVRKITEITNTSEQKDGEKGYAVAMSWLHRVVSRTETGLHEGFAKELREGEIGPVDNSSIVANGKVYVLWLSIGARS